MPSTTRQIITSALRLINVVQAGETPSPDDMNIAISSFDQMIDSWSNERLMVYSINPYIFYTVAGQKDYLLGPGNQIVTATITTAGSGYTNGVYTNVPLTTTTGTGSGALATITVAGGVITQVQISTAYQGGGMDYTVGDRLSASNTNLGGFGNGLVLTVASVTAGDWSIVRPLRIEQAAVIWNDPLSQQAVDIPLQLLTDSDFASIAVKNTPSTFPFALYDNGNYPLKTVTVWPVPTVATGLRMWLRTPLVNFTTLDQIVSYPPGYERAFRYCLAVELAPEFGKQVDATVANTALKAKQDLASINADPQYMSGDGGMSGNRVTWNFITGNFVDFGTM